MQERALLDTQVVSTCCSDESERATCSIEDSNHQCACAESKSIPVPVSLRLPQHSLGRQDASSVQDTEPSHPIRSTLLFAVACVTSPCCTPLFVPVGIALLAGTALAVWLTPHVGWVYAALTMISVLSLLLAFFSFRRRSGGSFQHIRRGGQA
jgi:hypothetical protein